MIILVNDDLKLREDSLTAEVGQHIYSKEGRDYYFICSLSEGSVLRTSHGQHSEQMTSLPEEVSKTFQALAFLKYDGLSTGKELENLFGDGHHYYNHSTNEFFFTHNCIDYSDEALFKPWTVVLSLSKYCEEVESSVYIDEDGNKHDLSVEDVAELGYLIKSQLEAKNKKRNEKLSQLADLCDDSVKKVEPKPFGRMSDLFRTPKTSEDGMSNFIKDGVSKHMEEGMPRERAYAQLFVDVWNNKKSE